MQANEVKIGDYINISTKCGNIVVGIVEYVYCTDKNIYMRYSIAATYKGIELLGLTIKHSLFMPVKDFSKVASKSDEQSIERFNRQVKEIREHLNQYFQNNTETSFL